MNTQEVKPQPTSPERIATERAKHIIDRLGHTAVYGNDHPQIITQFSNCLCLLDPDQQWAFCTKAARTVVNSGLYWGFEGSQLATRMTDLYWDLNPEEVRPVSPRELRRLTCA